MDGQVTINEAFGNAILTPRKSEFRRFVRVMFGRKVVLFGAVCIAILLLAAIFAPFISPYDPYKQDLAQALKPPSMEHWLGTDFLGRDVLSRLIYGSRVAIEVGLIAVGLASIIGFTAGLLAGYFGGVLDTIIMRLVDALMAMPPLALTLAIAAALGAGLENIMIAVAISMSPTFCRLMRGQVLSVKQMDYIIASRSTGASDWRIMLRHVLPNCFPPLIVLITLSMGQAVLIEASLSFLGIGIPPPAAAWGSMVRSSYQYLVSNPLLSFAPGAAIMLVVLAFNMFGDGLRDALDPRLRGLL